MLYILVLKTAKTTRTTSRLIPTEPGPEELRKRVLTMFNREKVSPRRISLYPGTKSR